MWESHPAPSHVAVISGNVDFLVLKTNITSMGSNAASGSVPDMPSGSVSYSSCFSPRHKSTAPLWQAHPMRIPRPSQSHACPPCYGQPQAAGRKGLQRLRAVAPLPGLVGRIPGNQSATGRVGPALTPGPSAAVPTSPMRAALLSPGSGWCLWSFWQVTAGQWVLHLF